MMLRKILKILTISLSLCLIIGIGFFLYNARHSYNINHAFTPLPLKFNPDNSSSTYQWNGTEIIVYNGFIKGIQKGGKEKESLVIRALSPLPIVELKAVNLPAKNISITIENINPEYYAKGIKNTLNPIKVTSNTLKFNVSLNLGERQRIKHNQTNDPESNSYVIIGDSRDGYETFGQVINQMEAVKPVFIINNGDLVYNGKPNQYRVFNRMVSKLSTTLCTTLGNHDIRDNGRETYTKLYGPNYYSFDFGMNHFAFLDSSPGEKEKQSITDEQYAWLERDLKKATGKRIFVISHIPPEDPRISPTLNKPYLADKSKKDKGFIEKKLEYYNQKVSTNHGFQDKQEAIRFENLMVKYKVNTVYLSHIHSYFDFSKNGVHYIITGGAGAELLTKNSYYHYLIGKTGMQSSITMVQLPSPPNKMISRYTTTASLFIEALYEENKIAFTFFVIGLILLVLLLLTLLIIKLDHRLARLWTLLKDTRKYMSRRHKELKKK